MTDNLPDVSGLPSKEEVAQAYEMQPVALAMRMIWAEQPAELKTELEYVRRVLPDVVQQADAHIDLIRRLGIQYEKGASNGTSPLVTGLIEGYASLASPEMTPVEFVNLEFERLDQHSRQLMQPFEDLVAQLVEQGPQYSRQDVLRIVGAVTLQDMDRFTEMYDTMQKLGKTNAELIELAARL